MCTFTLSVMNTSSLYKIHIHFSALHRQGKPSPHPRDPAHLSCLTQEWNVPVSEEENGCSSNLEVESSYTLVSQESWKVFQRALSIPACYTYYSGSVSFPPALNYPSPARLQHCAITTTISASPQSSSLGFLEACGLPMRKNVLLDVLKVEKVRFYAGKIFVGGKHWL